jgi:2-keto-4-pentenoate hydratase
MPRSRSRFGFLMCGFRGIVPHPSPAERTRQEETRMTRTALALSALAVPALLATPATAEECPEIARQVVEAHLAREALAAPDVADMQTARCVQEGVVTGIAGETIGWKVGLTSAAMQERLGVDQPVAGRLLEGMLLEDGARAERGYAARPLVEADLMVRVADAGIMQATDQEEALAHLDAFIPFIELADLVIAEGEELSAEVITAVNVGARLGVVGEPVGMEVGDEWLTALGGMTVRVETTDEEGEPTGVVGDYPGGAILGHPLEAVLWLVRHLEERGESLEAGDLVSLGSFGPPLDVPREGGIRVTYLRLPGGEEPTVLARFRD